MSKGATPADSQDAGTAADNLRSGRSDIHSMGFPLFALAKGGTVPSYRNGAIEIEVIPSARGAATIWDKDILLYLAARAAEVRDRTGRVPHEITVCGATLLQGIGRGIGGRDYRELEAALDRLSGTHVKTNVHNNGQRTPANFGFIGYQYIAGPEKLIRFELHGWLYQALEAGAILAVPPDFFALSGAIERRLYEIARRHCGAKASWHLNLSTLQAKLGSRFSLARLRYYLRTKIAPAHRLVVLDYFLSLGRDDFVYFFRDDPKGRSAWALWLKNEYAADIQARPHVPAAPCD